MLAFNDDPYWHLESCARIYWRNMCNRDSHIDTWLRVSTQLNAIAMFACGMNELNEVADDASFLADLALTRYEMERH